jgi:hypothetical protein
MRQQIRGRMQKVSSLVIERVRDLVTDQLDKLLLLDRRFVQVATELIKRLVIQS